MESQKRRHLTGPGMRGKIPKKTGIYTEIHLSIMESVSNPHCPFPSQFTDPPKLGLKTGDTSSTTSDKFVAFPRKQRILRNRPSLEENGLIIKQQRLPQRRGRSQTVYLSGLL